MISKCLRAIAVRVVYHVQQKLPDLHGQPRRTLVMMVSAFIAAGGPWLSQMGRTLADLSGTLQEKVKRMSRFLCRSEFDLGETFASVGRQIVETVAHACPGRMILLALDWTDLGDFMGLWLTLPYHGRALPLTCVVLAKAAALGSMTDEEKGLLQRFLNLFPQDVRQRLVILADRGFAKRELFDEIDVLGAHWAIRLPRDRQVQLDGRWLELRDVGLAPGQSRTLRQVPCGKDKSRLVNLAIRRLPLGEANDSEDDTWYIATDAQDIPIALSWYAARFQIEEMFRDFKSRLNIDRHQLKTESSVGKMMLIAALAYLVTLEDGTQWRCRMDLRRIQKDTAWGKLSVYGIARACFDLMLPEVQSDVAANVVEHWTNHRAA